MKIEVSDAIFSRLQKHATPLVDSVEDVIVKLIDFYDKGNKSQPTQMSRTFAEDMRGDLLQVPPKPLKGFKLHLLGVLKVTLKKRVFSLDDVYAHKSILQAKYPNNNNIKAAIRAGLQELRDLGYVRFIDGNGAYELLDI